MGRNTLSGNVIGTNALELDNISYIVSGSLSLSLVLVASTWIYSTNMHSCSKILVPSPKVHSVLCYKP